MPDFVSDIGSGFCSRILAVARQQQLTLSPSDVLMVIFCENSPGESPAVKVTGITKTFFSPLGGILNSSLSLPPQSMHSTLNGCFPFTTRFWRFLAGLKHTQE